MTSSYTSSTMLRAYHNGRCLYPDLSYVHLLVLVSSMQQIISRILHVDRMDPGTQLRDTCLGSATAGVVSRLLCHPLDTAKVSVAVCGADSTRSESTCSFVWILISEKFRR